jgi:winged helix DNA-binding protein
MTRWVTGLDCHEVPTARTLTQAQVLRRRTAAQLLHRPRHRSAADLVRHLTGVQAQVLSAAGLALRARGQGLTAAKVDRARVRDRSIVLTWAMRGTLHLIPAEDHGWLVPLVTEPATANAFRRLKQVGVPPNQPAKAIRLIERMLEREGPLSRPEIAHRLHRHGIRTEGQAIAHLVWLAASRGILCYGPDTGRQKSFVLTHDWLGEPQRSDPESTLTELAVRYLRAHGPAVPDDLAFWSGLRIKDAKRSWKGIQDRLVEVETDRGSQWALRSQKPMEPNGVVRLLPSFDEYLLGWRDRRPAISAVHWKKINRGGGWLKPVILVDGRLAGTWSTEATSATLRLRVHPFSGLSQGERRALRTDARDMADFLGTEVEGPG